MMRFVVLGLASGALGLVAAGPAHACGGGSCSTSAAPVATASSSGNRTYSYPGGGAYRPQMSMRSGMMGGSTNGAPRSAAAKAAGN